MSQKYKSKVNIEISAIKLSESQDCLISGYLYKEPDAKFIWQKRFCVLVGSVFHWFVDCNDTASHGTINLSDCKIIKESAKVVCYFDFTLEFIQNCNLRLQVSIFYRVNNGAR